jgi:hypothetical protein
VDEVMLKITKANDSIVTVGTWELPDEQMKNFNAQKDIGWHIFFALLQGAKKIEVVPAVRGPHG